MFKNFLENLKAKVNAYKRAEIEEEYNAVKQALIRNFEKEDRESNSANIPAFKRAELEMSKIKTRKMLDKYYAVYVKKSKRI